jgi:DNA-binding transcriptional LysR family regulator
MDRVLSLTVFRRVAELRSFSAAARELGLSNGAVSKHVAALEERVRARLLLRTTRRVSLTAAGETYLARCQQILDDLDELDQHVADATTTLRGTLRINVPLSFGLLYISPLLPDMIARWPELDLEVTLTDQAVDLVGEGVDVALRITRALPDTTTLIAHRLAQVDYVVCATPAYLKRHGTPRTPADLASHNCLTLGGSPWVFSAGGKQQRLELSGNLRINNSLVIRDVLLAGLGIGLLPRFYVHEQLRTKQLRAVLRDHAIPPAHAYALYARQRHLSAKIRAFVDYLREQLATAPWAMVA